MPSLRQRRAASLQPQRDPLGYLILIAHLDCRCARVSFYDCEGQRLSTLRVGRMPEAKNAKRKGC